MKRKLCEKIWISSLALVLLLITLFSSEGHWTDAFAARLFVDFDYDFKEVLVEKNLKDPRSFGFDSRAYGFQEEHPEGFEPYVVVWESELQVMAGVAARWGNIETGGELYGFLSPAKRPVVIFVTHPGPNAIHGIARFTQDLDFFKRVDVFMREYFGLYYFGNYHSHHILNIKEPSYGDIRSTNSIARKNGYQTLAQFVLTFDKKRSSSFRSHSGQPYGKGAAHVMTEPRAEGSGFTDLYARVKARFVPSHQTTFIRIHSFIYVDAARGEPIRCPIRILQGTSPFRRVIKRNTLIPELAKAYTFPMSRILFDSFDPPSESGDHDSELPPKISSQWLRLPEEVRKDTRATFKGRMIVLWLPLPAKGRLFVAYHDRPPYRVEAVYYSPNGKATKPIDLAKEALYFGPHTELARIYERVIRLAGNRDSPTRSDESGGTGEEVKLQEAHPIEQNLINEREESKRGGDEEVL